MFPKNFLLRTWDSRNIFLPSLKVEWSAIRRGRKTMSHWIFWVWLCQVMSSFCFSGFLMTVSFWGLLHQLRGRWLWTRDTTPPPAPLGHPPPRRCTSTRSFGRINRTERAIEINRWLVSFGLKWGPIVLKLWDLPNLQEHLQAKSR